jgi:hypothetical protein
VYKKENEDMKTFIDKLREVPVDHLEKMISCQKNQIKTSQRDLETMERVLDEKQEPKQ